MIDTRAERAPKSFKKLVELVSRLRSPGGCPWDMEQTHESLKPMMIEEAYEAVEAIDPGFSLRHFAGAYVRHFAGAYGHCPANTCHSAKLLVNSDYD